MEKKAYIYNNNKLAGYLSYEDNEYLFRYDDNYFNDKSKPAVCLSLPKTDKVHRSKVLFPFFFGLLAEGEQKKLQCRKLRIDENDNFIRLIKTAGNTIGSISVKEEIAE
jgi:serine/threonine-protein kinase HipA